VPTSKGRGTRRKQRGGKEGGDGRDRGIPVLIFPHFEPCRQLMAYFSGRLCTCLAECDDIGLFVITSARYVTCEHSFSRCFCVLLSVYVSPV